MNYFTKKDLTPWYPGDVNPVRPGLYEVNYGSHDYPSTYYQYFDGKFWYYGHTDPKTAMNRYNTDRTPRFYLHQWRGLKHNPDEVLYIYA